MTAPLRLRFLFSFQSAWKSVEQSLNTLSDPAEACNLHAPVQLPSSLPRLELRCSHCVPWQPRLARQHGEGLPYSVGSSKTSTSQDAFAFKGVCFSSACWERFPRPVRLGCALSWQEAPMSAHVPKNARSLCEVELKKLCRQRNLSSLKAGKGLRALFNELASGLYWYCL